ncbi:nucleoporin autopeptidase-domain-containing protein [Cytidiella melzeri]|nr:nucleoporin autopeptidase-domain-containing protein [Cytidiella melzeri]
MFGGLGATSNPAAPGTSGFGAFGTATNTPAAGGTSIFGAPKPTTGFGGFGTSGTTSAFGGGGTGAFGATTAGTGATAGASIFGAQPSTNTTTAFGGTGTGLFGTKPATGFGTTTANTSNTGSLDGVAPVTTGTSNPQYTAFSEKDTAPNSNVTLQYQCITCMPPYRGCSLEELRYQDYQQGRKTAGAFGQSTFGAPAAQPSTSMYGQPATSAQPANSLFGGFGANNTAGTGTNTTNTFGAFGQPAAPAASQPGPGGLFGGGAFGQPQSQPQQPSAFGGFGQQQPQQQQQQQPQQQPTTSLFGGGAFGAQSQQPKPFSGFGTSNTNAFGGTGSTFGQAATQQPAAPATGLFGQQQQPQQAANPFGGFAANTNAPKAGLFGQQAQPSGTFGGFGTQPQQTQPAQPTGGLFGNTGGLFGQNTQTQNQQPQQPAGTGLFGTQPTQPTTGGGLFGNNTTGTLFGNNSANQQQPQQQQQQQPTSGFSLFNKPAATTTGPGLFGGFGQSTTNNNAPAQQQGGLFGTPAVQTNAQPANNLFGGGNNLFARPATNGLAAQQTQQPGTNAFGGSFLGSNPFGASANTAGQPATVPQGGLTASIAQPIGANLAIFNLLPPGPRAISLDPPKKKTTMFADIPTRTPVPRLQLGYSPAVSKLRGFTSTSTSIPGPHGQSLGPQVSLTAGKPGALSLSKAANNRSILGGDAFTNGNVQSPGLGSGARQSVKKLVLNRKVEPSDLFSKSTHKITFSPALSIAAREAEAAAASGAGRRDDTPTPVGKSQPQRASGKFSAQPSADAVDQPAEDSAGGLKEGDYYVRPSLSELKQMSYSELGSTEGLVVGRVGYGEIEFLEAVDLTGLRRTTELLGDVVRFDDKECSVYPDSSETDKPSPGQGLNVAARITLVHCWALDKATRDPIKDEKHPVAIKHLNRLKKMKKTHFESFDIEEGKWVFTVDHF